MKKFLHNRIAKDFMTKNVISVMKGTPIHEIYKIFLQNNIMGVPVVDKEGFVVGIVTERDLAVREEDIKSPASVNLLGSVVYLEDMDQYNVLLKKKMGQLAVDVMSSPAKTLPENATVGEIIEFMDKEGINRVPIVNRDNKLCGIVTRTDIIRELIREKRAK
jgi:CBS domain-containing membrane protein